MTLEEAQARILELEEQNATLQTENENYSTQVTKLSGDLEKVREINQQYFLKLSAQYNPNPAPDHDEPDAPTCEDFAATLTI